MLLKIWRVCVHVHPWRPEDLDPLDLELQVVVSQQIRALRIEPRSSGGERNAPNY